MLLLDEPTNHLDAESVAWLERHLQEYPGTVVTVTHDRYFLDNVSKWILELDRGRGIPWEGNYSSWLEQKQQRLAIEEKQESCAAERAGQGAGVGAACRRGPGWRRTERGYRVTSRCRVRTSSAATSRSRCGCRRGRIWERVVVEAKDLKKVYGDRVLFEGMEFRLPPGGIVGVIGPNGAGKTTLFRMIVGQETPDGGELKVGESVSASYVDQSRETLNADKHDFPGDFGRQGRGRAGQAEGACAGVCVVVQLPGAGPGEEGRQAVGRRAEPGSSGEAAARAAGTCCCWTSRRTTWTWTCYARLRTR